MERIKELQDREVASGGLQVERYFTIPGVDPLDQVEWERRTARIVGGGGTAVFEQPDVEFPKFWSQRATDIVAQKYFRGKLGTPERERSVRQMIGRVTDTITRWGVNDGYFASPDDAATFRAELTHLLLHQMAAFNSPVWFNVGFEEKPQSSACQPYHALVNTIYGPMPIGEIVERRLIGLPVYDKDGITQVVGVKANGTKTVYRIALNDGRHIEATGDHLVCAHEERRIKQVEWRRVDELEVGMYMRVYPRQATTFTAPTAATEVSEAALAGWLQADGFVGQYPDGTNRSLTIEFMTVTEEEYRWVMEHLDRVFPASHRKVRDVEVQDQGLQCRRIRLYGEYLRPFVEKYQLLNRGPDLRVPDPLWRAGNDAVSAYLKSVFQGDGYASVHDPSAHIGFSVIAKNWAEDLQILLGRLGVYARLRQKRENRPDRYDLWELDVSIGSERARFAADVGFISEPKRTKLEQSLSFHGKQCPDVRYQSIAAIEPVGEMEVYDIQTRSGCYLTNNVLVHNCFILSIEDNMESILEWYRTEGMIFRGGSGSGLNLSKLRSSNEQLSKGGKASGPVSFMRGADSIAGTIKSGGKTRRAAKMLVLNVDHPDVPEFIWCKAKEERKAYALGEAGYDMTSLDSDGWISIQYQNANNSVRVTDEFMRAVVEDKDWHLRAVTTGEIVATYKARDLMRQMAEAAWECGDPGVQYDTTANDWHTCPHSGRINASNPCAEYTHLDDSACNLASLNLMKFDDTITGEFNTEAFRHAVDIIILAQEIIVGNSSYPTDKIAMNAKAYRQLGLGYANLGALLMARGLPYDSDEGRAYAASITALLTGEAYAMSARVAEKIGPFAGYLINREPMLRVIRKHRDSLKEVDNQLVPEDLFQAAQQAWDEALAHGEIYGYRNAQATVLAPTGCLVGNSLVATDRGLVRLSRLGNPQGEQWQDATFRVFTEEGAQEATQFYINGVASTRIIRTQAGYTIQGTPQHRIKVVDAITGAWVWRRFDEVQPNDIVPLAMNTLMGEPREVVLPPLGDIYWTGDYQTRVPHVMSPELAELIGYFMGDGSLHAKGLRFCVTEADRDVVDHLAGLVQSLFNLTVHVTKQQGYWEASVHSVPLTIWWEACGFTKQKPSPHHSGKGYLPYIPDAVLHTNDPQVYGAFLRGLFEADGTLIEGVPTLCTAHAEFAQEVRTLLLALGYPTSSKVNVSGWGQSDAYVLRLRNASYNALFREQIGFIGARKQSAIVDLQGALSGKRDYVYMTPAMVEELVPSGSSHRDAVLLSLRRHGAITRQRAAQIYSETEDERLARALGYFYDRVESNEDGGEQMTFDLSVPANVTYTANGFISHNTIAFLMDCDTTGVEPDIALVKYKKLVGGGEIKMINHTVPAALRRLGYGEDEIAEITAYIDERGTIEGAPHLKLEHLPVFDCAFRAANGTRSIHYMGHIRMMGVVQPFISGAISKTCNLPHDVTPDDIAEVYTEGWKRGLKALAIYRDGSKSVQPLSTGKEKSAKDKPAKTKSVVAEDIESLPSKVAEPVRHRLPDTRRAITHHFTIRSQDGSTHDGYITVGMYEDGSPGEIFVTVAKEGSTTSGLMDAFATAISIALQYGVPLEALVKKFSHMRFEPSGVTTNPEVRVAKSLVDYIFRWLASQFLDQQAQEQLGVMTPAVRDKLARALSGEADEEAHSLAEFKPKTTYISQADAPSCPDCGQIMVRNGSCYRCHNCGSTSGCS